jgi:hypothetical protein
MICRTFKINVAWGDLMIFAPKDITFKELIQNKKTRLIKKEHYVGLCEFSNEFLNTIDKDIIGNKEFHYMYYIPEKYKR